jgi:poly-gamma-glutamate synthesis protein (capsule biosynthesis protein)
VASRPDSLSTQNAVGPGGAPAARAAPEGSLRLFLCGDVMTGRGIDQLLPHPCHPELFEPWVTDAREYVALAEQRHGALPRRVAPDYPWGDALTELAERAPDLRIVNLETAVTADGAPWPDKSIHYRMHPRNAVCLDAAGIDCCVLANNHVLDWGHRALVETLETLHGLGIRTTGAGRNAAEATEPAVFEQAGSRVLVFGLGFPSSGIPEDWAAGPDRPGVHLLPWADAAAADRVAALVAQHRRQGDRVVVSVHWGPNWGYRITPEQRAFARRLVATGTADVVHGHSSHHPIGMERHAGRLILYGCGDFLNDYEGIAGYESYRGDLSLMYFVTLSRRDGALEALDLVPLQVHGMRLRRARTADAQWLADRLDRENRDQGLRVRAGATLEVGWAAEAGR